MNNELSVITMSIYPNPAHDEINIELNTHNSSLIAHLNIYDITGRLINSERVISDRATMDVKDLNAGIYLLELSGDQIETQIQKLILE